MFLHRKELIHEVNIGKPDARFGQPLLEQFGGATGELTVAPQYRVQSFHIENAAIRDMPQDIAIEEFSQLEMVGRMTTMHIAEMDQTNVHDAPLFAMKGIGPHFLDSQDTRGPWNEEPGFRYIADPEPNGGFPPPKVNAAGEKPPGSAKPAKPPPPKSSRDRK